MIINCDVRPRMYKTIRHCASVYYHLYDYTEYDKDPSNHWCYIKVISEECVEYIIDWHYYGN